MVGSIFPYPPKSLSPGHFISTRCKSSLRANNCEILCRFIIDMEETEGTGAIREFHPYRDLVEWNLEATYLQGDSQHDPMIPTLDEMDNYVDNDESLMALANRKVHSSRISMA